MTWHVGDVTKAQVTFTLNGSAADPTTVTLTVTDPAGTATAYTYADAQITRSGAGVFYRNCSLTSAGSWHFRMVGTGAVAAVADGSLFVKPART